MSQSRVEFEEHAQKKRSSIVHEFIGFMADNKKWWMAPIIVCLAALLALAFLAGTGAGPFVYTIF